MSVLVTSDLYSYYFVQDCIELNCTELLSYYSVPLCKDVHNRCMTLLGVLSSSSMGKDQLHSSILIVIT